MTTTQPIEGDTAELPLEKALEFVDRSTHFYDGSVDRRWVSGKYQIVAYEHADEITGSEGLLYFAFVAIAPLRADGIPGHVDNKRIGGRPYQSFSDAADACLMAARRETA
jgi:hypothetical protein